MASKHSDLWLWVGLAALSYYASMTVHRQLVNIREASQVTQADTVSVFANRQTEDAVKLETLGQLAQHYNHDIRAASVKILSERVLQGGAAWNLMLRDISGVDIERRNKALTCLCFVLPSSRNNAKREATACSLGTFSAIVDCLVNLLPLAISSERGSPSDSTYRTQPEREALKILAHIIPYNGAKAIEAGMFSRWLVNYPFGGPGVGLPQKWTIIIELSDGVVAYDDDDFGNAMKTILKEIFLDHSLSEEAVEHSLLPRDLYANQEWSHIPEDMMRLDERSLEMYQSTSHFGARSHDIPDDAFRTSEDWSVPAGNRRREESMEEREVRRRRREAVVIGREDGQPIQSQDIFQRSAGLMDEAIEEEEEELMTEDKEAEQKTKAGWWELLSRLRPYGLAPVSS